MLPDDVRADFWQHNIFIRSRKIQISDVRRLASNKYLCMNLKKQNKKKKNYFEYIILTKICKEES